MQQDFFTQGINMAIETEKIDKEKQKNYNMKMKVKRWII